MKQALPSLTLLANDIISLVLNASAPTLFRKKPSNLVVIRKEGCADCQLIHRLIERLPCNFIILKENNLYVHYLLYQPSLLQKVLCDGAISQFLTEKGYRPRHMTSSLSLLQQKYQKRVPDEIGIFLGYPLHDVIEFIKSPKGKGLYVGYWKVYHDLEESLLRFQLFDACKDCMTTLIQSNHSTTSLLQAIKEYPRHSISS